ncbi:MAG: hypothetical protein V7L31_07480 [Nostoc sp.]|uniref:hypothetical protein n=1 Tax=Nostoc sp. TaxID=1180 RepID=UPI002FF1FCA1
MKPTEVGKVSVSYSREFYETVGQFTVSSPLKHWFGVAFPPGNKFRANSSSPFQRTEIRVVTNDGLDPLLIRQQSHSIRQGKVCFYTHRDAPVGCTKNNW